MSTITIIRGHPTMPIVSGGFRCDGCRRMSYSCRSTAKIDLIHGTFITYGQKYKFLLLLVCI